MRRFSRERFRAVPDGARLAVVGADLPAAAAALALAVRARARGLSIDVELFAAPSGETAAQAPVLLTAAARTRLAALGARIPPDDTPGRLLVLCVVSAHRMERLAFAPGGLAIVDNWPDGPPGTSLVASVLRSRAHDLGVQLAMEHASRVTPTRIDPRRQRSENKGPVSVWVNGSARAFDACLVAGDCRFPEGGALLSGFRPAPTIPGVAARLHLSRPAPAQDTATLVLGPSFALDFLLLIPCPGSTFALAAGPKASGPALCRALAVAARGGWLPPDYRIASLSVVPLPAGRARSLESGPALLTGPAVAGHPLDLGLESTLTVASATAGALLDSGLTVPAAARHGREALSIHLRHCRKVALALRWLGRTRARGAAAVARSREAWADPFAGSTEILGLGGLPAGRLLSGARRAALADLFAPEHQAERFPAALGRRIVIVQRDPCVRKLLVDSLASSGLEALCLPDGLSLLCLMERVRPAAVLLELALPWIDGFTLCRELRKTGHGRAARIVITSEADSAYLRRAARSAGADLFLPKPCSADRLCSALLRTPNLPDTRVESNRHAS